MPLNRLKKSLYNLLWPGQRQGSTAQVRSRGPMIHVIILDGTMSSLKPGCETNAGRTYRLLSEIGAPVSVFYEAGVQWADWRSTHHVMLGRGLNRQIKRAFGYLASRYRPGDQIFFFGYSRGAYAVRSLAGVIDKVGLLKAECATQRNVEQAYRLYQNDAPTDLINAFSGAHCHAQTDIEMIGVWDTVKGLGIQFPLLWRLSRNAHAFHDHQLGASVRHGFHALALHETRRAFEPELWECPKDWQGRVEQVWFSGAHGDVGGHVETDERARPLANIPLVWMLSKAEGCGIPLPEGWQERFEQDPFAMSIGTWHGWSKLFWNRRRRRVGAGLCESLHKSVDERALAAGVAPSLPRVKLPPIQPTRAAR